MFISSQHPYASLNNIMTFLWCLWKARNDNLFQRKQGNPVQVYHAAHAILNCLSLENIAGNNKKDENKIGKDEPKENISQLQETTVQATKLKATTKIFTDAAWKNPQENRQEPRAGLGIQIQVQQERNRMEVKISASSDRATTPLQAEALATKLAAIFVQ